jgi:hypothetical protein
MLLSPLLGYQCFQRAPKECSIAMRSGSCQIYDEVGAGHREIPESINSLRTLADLIQRFKDFLDPSLS